MELLMGYSLLRYLGRSILTRVIQSNEPYLFTSLVFGLGLVIFIIGVFWMIVKGIRILFNFFFSLADCYNSVLPNVLFPICHGDFLLHTNET